MRRIERAEDERTMLNESGRRYDSGNSPQSRPATASRPAGSGVQQPRFRVSQNTVAPVQSVRDSFT